MTCYFLNKKKINKKILLGSCFHMQDILGNSSQKWYSHSVYVSSLRKAICKIEVRMSKDKTTSYQLTSCVHSCRFPQLDWDAFATILS